MVTKYMQISLDDLRVIVSEHSEVVRGLRLIQEGKATEFGGIGVMPAMMRSRLLYYDMMDSPQLTQLGFEIFKALERQGGKPTTSTHSDQILEAL